MATGDYITLAELKKRIWPDDEVPDDVNDTQLESVITATSFLINRLTGRRFYTTAADETRYYTADNSQALYLPDDIQSITTLQTDDDGDGTYEDTWTADVDYRLCPDTAATDGLPYTWIEVGPDGEEAFPVGIRRGVKIVGKFGYSSSTTVAGTPAIVRECCALQCQRLFERRNSPYGMIGNPVTGMFSSITELDPDIKFMLAPLTRAF